MIRLYKYLTGSDTVFGSAAFALLLLVVIACSCPKDLNVAGNRSGSNDSSTDNPIKLDDDMPSSDLLVAMVNETTADFAAAVATDDFSTLYSKSSPDFQQTYTEQQLRNIFKDFVAQKARVLPILNNALNGNPKFSPEPSMRTEKGLKIVVANGKYDSKPTPVNFEYEYIYRNGDWKLLKLVIKM
jgi:hypothetical protein